MLTAGMLAVSDPYAFHKVGGCWVSIWCQPPCTSLEPLEHWRADRVQGETSVSCPLTLASAAAALLKVCPRELHTSPLPGPDPAPAQRALPSPGKDFPPIGHPLTWVFTCVLVHPLCPRPLSTTLQLHKGQGFSCVPVVHRTEGSLVMVWPVHGGPVHGAEGLWGHMQISQEGRWYGDHHMLFLRHPSQAPSSSGGPARW